MVVDTPFETANDGGGAAVLLLCDHASNRVPPSVAGGDLGLAPADMGRHIAYDIGVRGVTLELARLMDAPAILSRFSRLVIDPNRAEDDPTLVMRIYDGTIVPANRHIAATDIERRLDAWHRPYHAAIDAAIETRLAADRPPALVAIHSFTPRLYGRAPRPWHIGVLWHRDDRLAAPLLARLRAEPDLCVGANQPYSGQLEGDTLSRHGTRRGLPHVLLELRQDLIVTGADQRLWAARLAPMLQAAIETIETPGMDDATTTELEAAAFRALRNHLRARTDVQNIDLMNLAGFCRNCLSRWYQEAAAARGVAISKDEARAIVYGMTYSDWVAAHQTDAEPSTRAKFDASH